MATCGPPTGPPYSAREAIRSFELEEGFNIEVFAAEPLVRDPVAMAIDEFGRVYVVEMPGYPLDTGGSGRVTMLQDRNSDGMPDHTTVFADGLRLPTGIMRWKNGILVTDPPDLLYYEDTDDDGHADIHRRILTGFALSNPQHNANAPVFGLDNWIYIANNGTISWTEKYADPFGDRGREIRFVNQADAPVLPRNGGDRNIRLRPDTYELEMLSGRSQFGHTFDAWGRHFLNDNSHHHYYEAIAARYFAARPDVAVVQAVHTSSDHGDAAAVFPITVNPEHQLLTDRGVFTSACGISYYLGGLFPAPYDAGVTFTAEPVHNLVHVDKVMPAGSGFAARRLHAGREFLASRDSWFRPVGFQTGPDGALYLLDYYRQIVEHPEWMDEAAVNAGDLQRGTHRGRIYRISPEGTPPAQWLQAIDTMHTDQLVYRLGDPNAWWRLTAQRLLVDGQDPAAVPLVRSLLENGSGPLARLHALWTLDGLASLQPADIRRALADPHPGVRENAVRLTEFYRSRWNDLTRDVVALAEDPEPRVRLQVLLTLGLMEGPDRLGAQRRILEQDASDAWTQTAALLSMPATELLQVAFRHPEQGNFVSKVSEELARIGAHTQLLRQIATTQSDMWWHGHALQGMSRGGDNLVPPELVVELIERYWDTKDQAVALAIAAILPPSSVPVATLERIRSVLADTARDVPNEVRAIRLLVRSEAEPEPLLDLLKTKQPLEVHEEVLAGLSRLGGSTAAEAVLHQWAVLTPRLRSGAWEVFRTQENATQLVEALENGIVQPAELPWQTRVRLMRDTSEPTRSRARSLLQLNDGDSRIHALPAFGDADRGEGLYTAMCSTCHEAATYGPDLATVAHWPQPMIASHIQEPNLSISSGYEMWEVITGAGDTLQGIIAFETPNAIGLASQFSAITILRANLMGMRQLPGSAMPENMVPDAQSLADIIAYLQRP